MKQQKIEKKKEEEKERRIGKVNANEEIIHVSHQCSD
jgi:hypothetical protein